MFIMLSMTFHASPGLQKSRNELTGACRAGSAEPIGGASRFQSLVNYYRADPRFTGQPDVLTFFSGDAFNPSLESTVTKGRHMVPFLNKTGINVACVGVSTGPQYSSAGGDICADTVRITILTLV